MTSFHSNQLPNQGSSIAQPTVGKNVDSGLSIQLSYYNTTVVGDGNSKIIIPFTIYQSAGVPLTAPVQVQAHTNIGSVKTQCSAPSVCNVTFTSPATINPKIAQISINAGGVIKNVSINIIPDHPASIKLDASTTSFIISQTGKLYAELNSAFYPQNSTQITAYVYDNNSNPIPDGVIVNFSASEGTPSNNSCITEGGSCSVIYRPEPIIGAAEIIASTSYRPKPNSVVGTIAQININVSTAPIAYNDTNNGTVRIINNSLEATAYSMACPYGTPPLVPGLGLGDCAYYNYTLSGSVTFEFLVKDVLNEPIEGIPITVNLVEPRYGPSLSCITNSKGICEIQYNVYLTNIENISDLNSGNPAASFWGAQFNISIDNLLAPPIYFNCGSNLACNYE